MEPSEQTNISQHASLTNDMLQSKDNARLTASMRLFRLAFVREVLLCEGTCEVLTAQETRRGVVISGPPRKICFVEQIVSQILQD